MAADRRRQGRHVMDIKVKLEDEEQCRYDNLSEISQKQREPSCKVGQLVAFGNNEGKMKCRRQRSTVETVPN